MNENQSKDGEPGKPKNEKRKFSADDLISFIQQKIYETPKMH